MTVTEFWLLLVLCLIAAGTGIGGLALGIKAHISVVRKEDFDKWAARLEKVYAAIYAGDTGRNGLAVEVKELRGLKHEYPSDQTAIWMQFALITCRTHKSSPGMKCGRCIHCAVEELEKNFRKLSDNTREVSCEDGHCGRCLRCQTSSFYKTISLAREDHRVLKLLVKWMQDSNAKFPITFSDDMGSST